MSLVKICISLGGNRFHGSLFDAKDKTSAPFRDLRLHSHVVLNFLTKTCASANCFALVCVFLKCFQGVFGGFQRLTDINLGWRIA